MSRKPVILVVTGYYFPGYKAGGVLRNIVNTVDNLCDRFEFKIVTRDRDLGDAVAYSDVRPGEWQPVGNASVCYLPPEAETVSRLNRLLDATPHDVLYLSSYFEPLTIRVLLGRKLRGIRRPEVIVAPFGEFAEASLTQKYPKKFVFMTVARLAGLYDGVTWRVSSEYEATDLVKVLGVARGSIAVTGDLPVKNPPPAYGQEPSAGHPAEREGLNVIFLSRIAREKNLDYALKVLKKVRANVRFDIYGPAENTAYWEECQRIAAELPDNVRMSYKGIVTPDQVVRVFAQYDLFLFPTGGEAYGNVIAESLAAGTPVLVSTETPWRDLGKDGLGWDLGLDDPDAFVRVIEEYAASSPERRREGRATVARNVGARLFDPEVLASNLRLFEGRLSGSDS